MRFQFSTYFSGTCISKELKILYFVKPILTRLIPHAYVFGLSLHGCSPFSSKKNIKDIKIEKNI